MQTKVICAPLGGVGVPGFGLWLGQRAVEVERETILVRSRLEVDNPLRMVADEKHRSFAGLLHRWVLLTKHRTSPEGGPNPRADFESHLIAQVVTAAEMHENAAKGQVRGRSMVLISAEYEWARLFLARYLGIDPKRVAECGSRADEVAALGGVR
jgi:hypothetical protein